MARVLIVDDDRDVLEVARRALESRGHEVRTASSAEDALAAARVGPWDLVIMDIGLPGRSGLAVVREMAQASGAPVCLTTGHADAELERDALTLGARALLAKPFDLTALYACVDRCLAS